MQCQVAIEYGSVIKHCMKFGKLSLLASCIYYNGQPLIQFDLMIQVYNEKACHVKHVQDYAVEFVLVILSFN